MIRPIIITHIFVTRQTGGQSQNLGGQLPPCSYLEPPLNIDSRTEHENKDDWHLWKINPTVHRWRRRDSTIELSRVGDVNAPVGSRDPVYNFLCCLDLLRHNDVIVEKVIDKNSRSQTAMQSCLVCFKTSTESAGSRRELVANSVHTADAIQLDSWVTSSRCVAVSPEINLPNRRIAQARGRETILECHITAHPHAVNYWHKDGRRIVSSSRSLHFTTTTQSSFVHWFNSWIISCCSMKRYVH